MPVFGQNKRRTGAIPLSQFETSTSDVLSASFDEAFEQNPFQRVLRYADTKFGDQTPVSAEEAKKYAQENYVPDLQIPEEGMTRAKLETLVEFKREQRVRQEAINAAGGGFINTATGLTASLVASVLDPINIAESFIPVVGAKKWASRIGAASGAMRHAQRFAMGFAAGVQGTILTEGAIAAAGINAELQEDIGFDEFLQMTLLGGVLGGGIHVGMGKIADLRGKGVDAAFEGAPETPFGRYIDRMDPEQRMQTYRHAIAALAEDRPVRMAPLAEAQRYADLREFDTLARQANEIAVEVGDSAELKQVTARMQRIAKRLGEDFEQPPSAKLLDDTTLKSTHADAEGKFNSVEAKKDLMEQVRRSIDQGDEVELKLKGKDAEPLAVKEVTARGSIKTDDGRTIKFSQLTKDGFELEVKPRMDPEAPRSVGIEELNALRGRFADEINPDQEIRVMDRLKEVNNERPGSLFVDEESYARFQADQARIEKISNMPENQRVKALEQEISDVRQRLDDAFPELDAEAKKVLDDVDFEVKQSRDFIDGLKAMGNCLVRGK